MKFGLRPQMQFYSKDVIIDDVENYRKYFD